MGSVFKPTRTEAEQAVEDVDTQDTREVGLTIIRERKKGGKRRVAAPGVKCEGRRKGPIKGVGEGPEVPRSLEGEFRRERDSIALERCFSQTGTAIGRLPEVCKGRRKYHLRNLMFGADEGTRVRRNLRTHDPDPEDPWRTTDQESLSPRRKRPSGSLKGVRPRSEKRRTVRR